MISGYSKDTLLFWLQIRSAKFIKTDWSERNSVLCGTCGLYLSTSGQPRWLFGEVSGVVSGVGLALEEFPLCSPPSDEVLQPDCFGIYVPMKTFVAEHYHPTHLLQNFLCRLS